MELAVAKKVARDRFERDTVQAYQTIRIWAMTRSSKGRMPSIGKVLGTDASSFKAGDSPQKARAFMEILAARTKGQLKPVNKNRLIEKR